MCRNMYCPFTYVYRYKWLYAFPHTLWQSKTYFWIHPKMLLLLVLLAVGAACWDTFLAHWFGTMVWNTVPKHWDASASGMDICCWGWFWLLGLIFAPRGCLLLLGITCAAVAGSFAWFLANCSVFLIFNPCGAQALDGLVSCCWACFLLLGWIFAAGAGSGSWD